MKDIYEANFSSRNLFEEADTDSGWEELYTQISTRKKFSGKQIKKRLLLKIGKYAAIFLIGIFISSLFFYLRPDATLPLATPIATGLCEIRTDKGESVTVTLPDGSSVKLNACSYLGYQSDFGKNDRILKFVGEGYFDVRTNADIPFVVETFGLQIKAFGTTFNVKAYEDEEVVETTLIEGVVTVETENNKPIVTLKPDQVISIPKALVAGNRETKTGQSISEVAQPNRDQKEPSRPHAVLIDNIVPEVYTSWKDDKWVIEAENLESLAKKIERKYNVSITIKDESIKKYAFTGTLRDYPLEQVLEIIKVGAPIQYAIKEKDVVINKDKRLFKEYEKLINQHQISRPMYIE